MSTVSKRQEKSKNDETRLRAILDTAVDAIITINEDRIVQDFNPGAEKLFGYSLEEVVGENVKMLMPEYYKKQHDGFVNHYLETGERKVIGLGREVEGQRKDGTIFPIYLSVGEATIEGKRLFTGIIHDITEQKESEKELIANLKRLEAKGVSRYDTLITQKNSYLIKEKSYERSLAIFSNLTGFGFQGLCLTTKHPDVLTETYSLENSKGKFLWLSSSGAEESVTNPSNLTDIHGKVNEFIKNNEAALILFLGLEYIITVNEFEKSLKFVNSIVDAIIVNNARLIISIDPETLRAREVSMLEKLFTELKDEDIIRLGLE